MDRPLTIVTAAAAILSAALVVWLSDSHGADLFSILLVAWMIVPYALLALVPRLARRLRPGASAVPALVTSLAALGFAAYLAYEVFVAHPDAQGPIALLFLPLCQLAAVPVAFVVTLFTGRRRGV